MAEGPLVEVPLDAGIARVLADDRGKLVEQDFTFAVSARAVSPVGHVVVRMGGKRLLATVAHEVEVAAIGPVMRFSDGFAEFLCHEFGFNPRGKALVHPFVQALIGGQQPLKPGVRHLMGGDTDEAAQLSVASNEGAHGVFHAAVSALDHRVLWPGVIAHVLGVVAHGPFRDGGQFIPRPIGGVGLADEVQGGPVFHLASTACTKSGSAAQAKSCTSSAEKMPVEWCRLRPGVAASAVTVAAFSWRFCRAPVPPIM